VPFGPHGIPCRRDWLELTHFFRDRHSHRRTVAPALLRILAQIQSPFGGRRINLYSRYCAPDPGQSPDSYHEVGHASDVAIEGIEPRALFEYCRQLQVTTNSGLGCGLYAHRAFVHVDARSRSVIWVDLDYRSHAADPQAWLDAHSDAGAPKPGPRLESDHPPASRCC